VRARTPGRGPAAGVPRAATCDRAGLPAPSPPPTAALRDSPRAPPLQACSPRTTRPPRVRADLRGSRLRPCGNQPRPRESTASLPPSSAPRPPHRPTQPAAAAADDRRDDAASAPLAGLPPGDPRAEDAGGLSGSRAGRGGVGSTLAKLDGATRDRLLELSRVRQWAHIEKVRARARARGGGAWLCRSGGSDASAQCSSHTPWRSPLARPPPVATPTHRHRWRSC
jgi:hypothetical protein